MEYFTSLQRGSIQELLDRKFKTSTANEIAAQAVEEHKNLIQSQKNTDKKAK